jgi:hypothetical protein
MTNGRIRRPDYKHPDYKTQIFCFYNKIICTLSQGGKKKFLGFWGVIVKLLMFWKIFIGVLEKSCKDWFLFYCPTKILMILLYVFPEKQKYFQL